MKWDQVQKPLRDGFQAFREEWPEDRYVMLTESGRPMVYRDMSDDFQTEAEYRPTESDLSAVDWAATGPSGN